MGAAQEVPVRIKGEDLTYHTISLIMQTLPYREMAIAIMPSMYTLVRMNELTLSINPTHHAISLALWGPRSLSVRRRSSRRTAWHPRAWGETGEKRILRCS